MLKRNSINVHLLTRQPGLEIWCLSKVRTRPAGRIGYFGIFFYRFHEKPILIILHMTEEHIFLTEHSLHYAELSS